VHDITKEFDTIVAIATPPGEGAISIVRLSGNDAIKIVSKIFNCGRNQLKTVKSHTIHYGKIHDYETQKMVDEVMVSVMRAPRTFTREDVVEINCHGGSIVVNCVLQLILRSGARLAQPGEFTKRAFLNGRIDLSQAEAVMDVIRAKTERATSMAIDQLDGNLSSLIKKIRQDILNVLAQIEVNINYPEYDEVEEMTTALLLKKAEQVKEQLSSLLLSAKHGKILREGLALAIIGRTNVGKSSLLNSFAKVERAIVTNVAGTTRDVIEEYVNVCGVPLKLMDTAGIRETEDLVEKIGVELSRKVMKEADLVLLVLDASEKLTSEDLLLLAATQEKNRLVLLNKTDLPEKIDFAELAKLLPDEEIFKISVLQNFGLKVLEKKIANLFFKGKSLTSKDATYLSNARQIALIEQAQKALEEVISGIRGGTPVDLVQIDFNLAWDYLGEVIGESVPDELVTQLFSQFCLGK